MTESMQLQQIAIRSPFGTCGGAVFITILPLLISLYACEGPVERQVVESRQQEAGEQGVETPDGQDAARPGWNGQPPFGLLQEKAVILGSPIGGSLFQVGCKDNHQFFFVATTSMPRDVKISDEVLRYTTIDGGGTEYTPVAFALPSTAYTDVPFVIQGRSFSEGITNVTVDETYLALVYVVPTSAITFKLRLPNGDEVDLPILEAWEPGDAVRLEGYESGDLTFGIPSIEEEGWGIP